ncbi:hypothetical protein V1506DRAFT_551901 [Lipomyces tetrasporus]
MFVSNWFLILSLVGGAPLCFCLFFLPRPSFRHLKSSAAFVKRTDSTESLLADAVSAKYKVHIEHDSPLSSCSYMPSPYIPSLLIPPRTSRQKRMDFVVACCLLSIVLVWGAVKSYVNVDNSGHALVCLLLGVKRSFKEDDVSCATVYFNCSKENWAESSEVASFNSSEKIEISINWVQDLLLLVLFGIWQCGGPLLTMVYGIFRAIQLRDTAMSVIFYFGTAMIFVLLCSYLVIAVMGFRTRRQSISTVEKADVLKFDVKKVVRKFAQDLAKDLGPKWWIARDGAYLYFIIFGEDLGLVYGRMSAKKDLADHRA